VERFNREWRVEKLKFMSPTEMRELALALAA